jgi:ubiquinone biosynthesis protein
VEIKAVTRLGRFKDIAITLFRYGFDDVVERLDLPGKVLFEKIRKVDREMSTWERIRHMLVDLGPTYIKFGQIMSLRPDLSPTRRATTFQRPGATSWRRDSNPQDSSQEAHSIRTR